MQPKTKTILFILLSFFLGAICGWFIESRVNAGFFHPDHRRPGDYHKMMSERLHLTDCQITQVDSILEIRRQRVDMFRKHTLAVWDTVRMEIRKLLDSNQVKIFDEIIQDMHNREGKRWDRESPPPPPSKK
jgi:hypothetical protein